MSDCYVCRDTTEVLHFDHLYVNGSEGCHLCLECRIAITSLLRDMRSRVMKSEVNLRKKLKKEASEP